MANTQKQRVLNIDGALNFRDMGGYVTASGQSVQWGKIFRSAQLDRLSPQGVQEMAELGIKTVVDLRFSDETQKYPTIRAAVPEAEILSWHDEKALEGDDKSAQMKRAWRESLDSNDPNQVREAMRANYPQKLYTHRAIYRKMLVRLSEGQTPLVFHCAAGKDRTGVGAALILSLLGVSNEVIIEDYMLTQQELEGRVENWFAGGATTADDYENFQDQLAEHSSEMLKPIFEADLSYITTLLEYVDETYGNFERYANTKLGLDARWLQEFQNRLLK
ncbi:MAG: tyrosine-protein phosphatase [Pseudomonadota bacterium]